MKKLLIIPFLFFSLIGISQHGLPIFATAGIPTTSGNIWINSDSLKLQFNLSGTTITVGGTTGTSLTNPMTTLGDMIVGGTGGTAVRFPVAAHAGMKITSISGGIGVAWQDTAGASISGLTTNQITKAASATSITNSNLSDNGNMIKFVFGSGPGYANYFGKASGNNTNIEGGFVFIGDSGTTMTEIGSTSAQLNSAIFQVGGVSQFNGNAWFGSGTTLGLRINYTTPNIRFDQETTSGGYIFTTNGVSNSNCNMFTGGNNGFMSTTDSNAIVQIGKSTTANANIRFALNGADVTSPTNGMLWYNSNTHALNFRDNGTTVNLLNGGVVAGADLTAQSGTVSSVTTFTPAAAGTFRIGCYTAVTAISAGTLTMTVTWTDENSTSRTLTFFPMGLTTAGLSGTGFTGFPPADIRSASGSAITVVATFAGVSITYDVGGTIQKLR